jgi:2-polyprenyl-3-methyl-5-hydroxy-6-metoxy-1,4-benzoquinol methylase
MFVMEQVQCNLCGSIDASPLFVKQGYHIVRCKICDLVYVNPRNTPEELRKFYDEAYHEFIDHDPLKCSKAKLITKRLLKYSSGNKLLDIGCSTGTFLNEAKQEFNVTGLELASWSADFARKTYNLQIVNTTLSEAKFPDHTFDIITFFELIEHIHNPFDFLREVNRILCPGGIIALSTGNVDSLDALLQRSAWYYYAPQFHLYYFSLKTLSTLLKKCGFKTVKITGSEALSFFDMLSLYPIYRHQSLFARQIAAKIHVGQFSTGCIGIYARKINEI